MDKNIEILSCSTDTSLGLPFADQGVRAGFPSPAQDFLEEVLDFNKDMIKHPDATYYARVRGDSMIDAGIHEDDIVLVDRAIDPKSGYLAVCCLDGDFTLKKLLITSSKVTLLPANGEYKPIPILPEHDFQVWGVVSYIIHKTI